MIPRDVKSPTVSIPFHKLLRVVAIIDPNNPQTQQLPDHIRAENFEVEVADTFDRDVSEDAAVGAYIALVDGDPSRNRSIASRASITKCRASSRNGWMDA
jgi:ornithine decarboxylase